MLRRVNNAIFLKQLNHFDKNFSVLIEKIFVVNIFESKLIVRIKFQNTDCFFQILDCMFSF